MRGPALRALRLLAAFVALGAIALVANRWHAGRALGAARARSEALGLRLDPGLLELELSPEARAALTAARALTNAIGERAVARYDAEMKPGEYSEERLDALTGDEAYRDAAALEAAARRFLAASVKDQPEAQVWRELRSAASDGTETHEKPWLARYSLVESLCGAARVATAAGDPESAWRWIELAAQLCAEQCDTDMTGVSALGLFIQWLHRAHVEAIATAPDDPARDRVRAALSDLDIIREARAALRRDASLFLHLASTPELTGFTHRAHLRLMAHDVRDKAMLHATWTDIIEAIELPSDADQRAALDAVDARTEEVPRTYALTLLTVPRALSFWEHARTFEAELDELLAK